MVPVNLFAVSMAAIASFIFGFLLHGPIAGKLWMRLADIHPTGNEKLSDMLPQLGWNLVTNFVTALIFFVIYLLTDSSPYLIGEGVLKGVFLGIVLWGGFIATTSAIEVIWMGRSFKLWLFEAVCSLLSMSLMGIVLVGLA